MARFEVHRGRPYRDDDLSLPRVLNVTANRFEVRGSWLVFIDDKNSDVAVFNQGEITGAVPVDDVAPVPIAD